MHSQSLRVHLICIYLFCHHFFFLGEVSAGPEVIYDDVPHADLSSGEGQS